MLCPVCDTDMAVVEFHGVELDVCPACRGIWFDADELRVLFEKAGSAPNAVSASLRAMPRRRAARKMRCPRCRRRLAEFVAAAGPPPLVLDRCVRGDGLWLDHGELPRLLAGSMPSDGALGSVTAFLGEFARPTEV